MRAVIVQPINRISPDASCLANSWNGLTNRFIGVASTHASDVHPSRPDSAACYHPESTHPVSRTSSVGSHSARQIKQNPKSGVVRDGGADGSPFLHQAVPD